MIYMGEQEVYVPIMCPKDSQVIQENWHILVRQKFQFFGSWPTKRKKNLHQMLKQFIDLINLYQELT